MACNGARRLGGLGLVAALIGVAAACTGSSGSGTDAVDNTRLAVNGVERVFITRPFGAPLSAVLVYLDFEPEAPRSLSVEALGSDGRVYRGTYPRNAKICGFPDYLGSGSNTAEEGDRRARAFIVPSGLTLTELRWRPGADAPETSTLLPEESLVCVP